MTEPTEQPTREPATLEQLENAFPDASPEFILANIKAQATLPEAMEGYTNLQIKRIGELEARIADLEQENHKLTEAQKKVTRTATTPQALGMLPKGAASESADFVDAWNARIAAEVKSGKTREQAMRDLIKAEPELHQEYLAEYTASHQKN